MLINFTGFKAISYNTQGRNIGVRRDRSRKGERSQAAQRSSTFIVALLIVFLVDYCVFILTKFQYP